MKKALFITFLLTASICHAQDTLNGWTYLNYSYKLLPDIKPDDSASVVASFTAIGKQMIDDSKKYTEKPLQDSSVLKDVYYSLMYGSLYLKDYAKVVAYVNEIRKLSYKKKFTAPPYAIEKAYAVARLDSSNEKDFDRRFEQALLSDLTLVDPDFVKDAVSELKGAYDTAAATTNKNEAAHYIKEALRTDSELIMYNMPWAMEKFFKHYIIVNEGNNISRVLDTLSPERIEMQPVKIPTRDGIHLGGLLFRNIDEKEKVPAIISQSPYPGGNEAMHGNIFGVNGYAYLYVDCRGKRSSEGEFFPWENDSRDYYDIIDWASKQPWCNGKVATTGGSYLGFTQWQAIRKENRHPALKAINPMVSVAFGIDFPWQHQMYNNYALQWAMYVQGKEANSALFDNWNFWGQKGYGLYKNHIPFAKLDSVAGVKNSFFTKWLQHPDFDDYWKSILPKKEDYRKLDIPVLTITGYYDGDQAGALYYYKNHLQLNPKTRHYMIIGPFDHGGAQWMPAATQGGWEIDEEAQIPLYKYVIQWFDWALKGKPLPSFFKDKVAYYVPGKHSWKTAPSLNSVTKDSLKFYLTSARKLNDSSWLMQKTYNAMDTVFTFSHDMFTTLDSLFIFASGQVKNYDSVSKAFNNRIDFVTPPFDRDMLISGNMASHLFTSLNVPDADIAVSYYVTDSTGNERYLSKDKLRTRYRNSAEHPTLMKPGKPELLHFNDSFFEVMPVKKGERLILSVQVEDWWNNERNYGFGGVVSQETATGARNIEVKIYAGKKFPSYLAVPVQYP